MLRILLVTALCFTLTADVFSQTEQAQLNGVSSAKAILAGVASSQKIPESAKVSFLNTLGTVEKSPSVRVPYSRMSDWRKKQFEKTVTEWAEQFPKSDYQTEIIIKAHESQRLLFIAQLFVIPPLNHTPVPLKKAYDQLTGIEHWVRSDVEARLKILSKEIVKQYPVLGDTFALTLDDSLCSFHCAFQPEDDLNPFQRTPLTDKDFERLKKKISGIMGQKKIFGMGEKSGMPRIRDFDLDRINHVASMKQNKEKEEKIPLAISSIAEGISKDVTSAYASLFWKECRPVITKAYYIRLPGNIDRDYRKYAAELARLIDDSAVKKSFDEYNRINQAQAQKWTDDKKKEFAMVVASQPKELAYDISAAPSLLWRMMILAVVNVVIISLVVYFVLRRRKRTGESQNDKK